MLTIALASAVAIAQAAPTAVRLDDYTQWRPADLTTQSRAPCPMLNTLANHGFLPRDGRNISADLFADTLKTYLNVQRDFWWTVADSAIKAVAKSPDQTTIDLEELKKHNAIQHDAALTRNDIGYGKYYTQVNHTLVDQLVALADSDGMITAKTMAKARKLRQAQSAAWNPNYDLPFGGIPNVFDPVAAIANNKWFLAIDQAAVPLTVLGDRDEVNGVPYFVIPKDRLKYFLDNERLPVEKGWTKSSFELSRDHVFQGIGQVVKEYLWLGLWNPVSPTGLYAGPEPNPSQTL